MDVARLVFVVRLGYRVFLVAVGCIYLANLWGPKTELSSTATLQSSRQAPMVWNSAVSEKDLIETRGLVNNVGGQTVLSCNKIEVLGDDGIARIVIVAGNSRPGIYILSQSGCGPVVGLDAASEEYGQLMLGRCSDGGGILMNPRIGMEIQGYSGNNARK